MAVKDYRPLNGFCYAYAVLFAAFTAFSYYYISSQINECDMTYSYPEYSQVSMALPDREQEIFNLLKGYDTSAESEKISQQQEKEQPISKFAYKYRLFQYSDGRVPLSRCGSGTEGGARLPILFVPGHGGSYKQVRSVAGTSLSLTLGKEMVWFTIDFGSEPVAVDGKLLYHQAEFIKDSLSAIQQHMEACNFTTYSVADDRNVEQLHQTLIVAHSMGGIAARMAAVLLHDDVLAATAQSRLFGSQNNATHAFIPAIITLGTPHASPPVHIDGELQEVYRWMHEQYDVQAEKGWHTLVDEFVQSARNGSLADSQQRATMVHGLRRSWLHNMMMLSLSGGQRDLHVRELDTAITTSNWASHLPGAHTSAFTSPPSPPWASLSTSALPGVHMSADHAALLWCKQIVDRLAEVIIQLLPKLRAATAVCTEQDIAASNCSSQLLLTECISHLRISGSDTHNASVDDVKEMLVTALLNISIRRIPEVITIAVSVVMLYCAAWHLTATAGDNVHVAGPSSVLAALGAPLAGVSGASALAAAPILIAPVMWKAAEGDFAHLVVFHGVAAFAVLLASMLKRLRCRSTRSPSAAPRSAVYVTSIFFVVSTAIAFVGSMLLMRKIVGADVSISFGAAASFLFAPRVVAAGVVGALAAMYITSLWLMPWLEVRFPSEVTSIVAFACGLVAALPFIATVGRSLLMQLSDPFSFHGVDVRQQLWCFGALTAAVYYLHAVASPLRPSPPSQAILSLGSTVHKFLDLMSTPAVPAGQVPSASEPAAQVWTKGHTSCPACEHEGTQAAVLEPAAPHRVISCGCWKDKRTVLKDDTLRALEGEALVPDGQLMIKLSVDNKHLRKLLLKQVIRSTGDSPCRQACDFCSCLCKVCGGCPEAQRFADAYRSAAGSLAQSVCEARGPLALPQDTATAPVAATLHALVFVAYWLCVTAMWLYYMSTGSMMNPMLNFVLVVCTAIIDLHCMRFVPSLLPASGKASREAS